MKLVIDIPEEYYKTIKETKKEVVPIGWASIREGIEYKERPRGEWVFKNGKYRCSICLEPCATFYMNEPRDNFCLYCGSDNRREGE